MVFETGPQDTDRQEQIIERTHELLLNELGEQPDTVEVYGVRDRVEIQLL